ncbi:MAG TPA: hypothetical protein VK731_13255, partial [Candidatus Cybelea sp.]|nr:hypothetical protein [Candidatus Cybelea sp.]
MSPRPFSSPHRWQKLPRLAGAVLVAFLSSGARGGDVADPGARAFEGEVKPLVGNYCLKCHSTAKHKGD